MSMSYWMCEGIGLNIAAVETLLDYDKLAKALYNEPEVEFDEQWKTEFAAASKDEKKDMVLEVGFEIECGNGFASILSILDPRNWLESTDDGEGEYFLLYPPKYPWQIGENEPNSPEEVKEYICDLIVKFAVDGIDRAKVMEKIGEVYEVGIG